MGLKRRIIVYDDGDPLVGAKSVADLLAVRFKPCVDTQVDSYFWNIGHGMMLPPTARLDPNLSKDANREFATRVMIEQTRKVGMEMFGSLRMNDIHDAWGGVTYPLKRERPDLLIGDDHAFEQYPHLLDGEKPKPLGGYPETAVLRAFWSGFDYAEPEVRRHRLEFIEEFCRKYDLDGLELDYFRHPLFFKPGEEEEHLDTMTGFVRQVRRVLNEIGRERGRPYLLATRVPDTPEWCLRTGLDVERWLREGLLDLLIVGGGYMPYAGRYKQFIDLAHRYNVPAYPCMNHFRAHKPMRALSVASNFWALGGDGVYIFNYDGAPEGSPHRPCLSRMGSPDTLLGVDKSYQPDPGCSIWYCGYANAPAPFPVRLVDGLPIELVVGDDLGQATRQGILETVRLRVHVAQMHQVEEITIRINGVRAAREKIVRTNAQAFEAEVAAPPLQRGINQIVVLPGRNCIGRLSSQVTGLELSVRYKPE